MLNDYLKLPRSCVYLIREGGMPVLVGYSINIGLGLASIYENEVVRALPNPELVILGVSSDIETLKLHTDYWNEVYGLSRRSNLKYRVRIVDNLIMEKIDVVLVNSRNDKKVVGRFTDRLAAQEFIGACYGSGNVVGGPVYALNSLTKELLSRTYERRFAIID